MNIFTLKFTPAERRQLMKIHCATCNRDFYEEHTGQETTSYALDSIQQRCDEHKREMHP